MSKDKGKILYVMIAPFKMMYRTPQNTDGQKQYNVLLLADIISVLIVCAHKQAFQTEVIGVEVIP